MLGQYSVTPVRRTAAIIEIAAVYRWPLAGVIRTLSRHRPRAEFDPDRTQAGLAGCERGHLDFRTIQAFSKDLGMLLS